MMIKSQKFIAKTVDEAKKMAADAFGVPMSDIKFEIIEEPKRGLFGIGLKGNATVKATYETIDVSTIDRHAVETSARTVSEPAPAAEEIVSEPAPAAEEAVSEPAPAVEEAVSEPAPAVEEAVSEPAPAVEEIVSEPAPAVEEIAGEIVPEVQTAAPLTEETAPAAEAVPVGEEVVVSVEEETVPIVEKATAVTELPAPKPARPENKKPAKPEPKQQTPLQLDEELITGDPSASALEKIEKAKAYLLSVLKQMEIEADLVVNAGSESAMIDIVSQNSGTVIGKRGETLDALQYLTFMIANRGDKEYYRIILNSANYRERRRKTLEELAAKIAKNVLRSGRQTTLEPMNPYERRIIHSAIAEIEGVTSRSVGEEPYRKVIISSTSRPPRRGNGNGRGRFDRNDKNERRGGGRDRRGGRNDRDRRRSNELPSERISMDSMKTSFEKDYKRPKADDEINAGLYGKIEF